MKRYWFLATISVLIGAFLIGGRAMSETTQDKPKFLMSDENRQSGKILDKLSEVLKNQEVMLKELEEIKSAVNLIKK